MAEEKLLLVFLSAQNMEIEMVRSLLESNGIEAFVMNDRLVPRLIPFYTQVLGAVKLFVQPKDFKEACDVLRAHIKDAGEPPFLGAFSSIGTSPLRANAEELSIEPSLGGEVLLKKALPRKMSWDSFWLSPDGFLILFIGVLALLCIIKYF